MTALRTGMMVVGLGVGLAGLLAGDAATVGVGRAAGGRGENRRLVRDQVAVPARPVGHGARVPVPGRRMRRRDESLPARQARLLQLCDRRGGRRRARPRRRPRAAQRQIQGNSSDGRSIKVGWMNGRSRPYRVAIPYAAPRDVLAIAFNGQMRRGGCDRRCRSGRRGRACRDRFGIAYRALPQKRWMRRPASSSSAVEAA